MKNITEGKLLTPNGVVSVLIFLDNKEAQWAFGQGRLVKCYATHDTGYYKPNGDTIDLLSIFDNMLEDESFLHYAAKKITAAIENKRYSAESSANTLANIMKQAYISKMAALGKEAELNARESRMDNAELDEYNQLREQAELNAHEAWADNAELRVG